MPDRDNQIDLVKTVAIISVITIHVTSYGWAIYPIGSVPWIANMFWASLTRAAVPLFLMCSGVLFLNPGKELSLKKLYTKYLPRVVAAMIVWAMAYKIYALVSSHTFSAPGLWQAFKEVLVFNQEFHFYYIHIIILVYICLPILRVFLAKADRRQLEYSLAVWFVFAILYPTVVHFWPFHLITGFPLQWMPNMTYAAFGYLVLGYYLKFVFPPGRGFSFTLFALGFLIVFSGTWNTSVAYGRFYDGFLGGMTAGVALMTAGIFGACRLRGGRISAWIAKASFCIYLSHVFFLYLFEKAGFGVGMFTPLLSAPIITAAIFLCGCGVYAVLSWIPVVKQWLI